MPVNYKFRSQVRYRWKHRCVSSGYQGIWVYDFALFGGSSLGGGLEWKMVGKTLPWCRI